MAKLAGTRWLKAAGAGLIALCLLIGLGLADVWVALGKMPAGERLARNRASPQFNTATFTNPLTRNEPELLPILKAYWRNDAAVEPSDKLATVPRKAQDFETISTKPMVTWLGHSTLFIEVDGMRFLTDPVWGQRASPSDYYGPKRFYQPPLSLDALPHVDAVLISHDHYDHLDHRTIVELAKTEIPFLVPLGVGAHLEYWGVPKERIQEFDWWQESQVGSVRLVATPARHFSGRHLLDRDHTLWTSWSVLGENGRVFFSGDTAMFPGFREIGDKLGPFDITLMELGAYSALWADVHLGPEQAVQAHIDLRGELMMGIHWGTFNLALHSWAEPPERLLAESKRRDVRVVIPKPGQSFNESTGADVVRWWPPLPWQTAEQAPVVSSGLVLGAKPVAKDQSVGTTQ